MRYHRLARGDINGWARRVVLRRVGQSSVGGKMRGRALVVLAGLAAIAVVALVGGAFKGGSHAAARYSKFSLTDPDSKAQDPGLGPGMTYDAYLQEAQAYPAANVTPDEVANAEATFNALANSDAK